MPLEDIYADDEAGRRPVPAYAAQKRYPVLSGAAIVARFMSYASGLVALFAAMAAVLMVAWPAFRAHLGAVCSVCLGGFVSCLLWRLLSDVFDAIVETEKNTREILELTRRGRKD